LAQTIAFRLQHLEQLSSSGQERVRERTRLSRIHHHDRQARCRQSGLRHINPDEHADPPLE
jgi:hypothetical protein